MENSKSEQQGSWSNDKKVEKYRIVIVIRNV